MKFWSLAIVLGVACCVGQTVEARHVAADPLVGPTSKRMYPYGRAEAPIGYQDFCKRHAADCLPIGSPLQRVQLTADKWRELVDLNKEINEAIRPVSDMAQYGQLEYWEYPTSGMGDCEDYVLLKRRELMQLGWPQSALLITVVRDENSEGHAILTVRTTQADYVLDNKHSRVVSWQRTPYDFIKRQSGKDPRQWVSLVPVDPSLPVASAGVDWKD
jgi:predicted transglutaminase-like cysteine proteinase